MVKANRTNGNRSASVSPSDASAAKDEVSKQSLQHVEMKVHTR